MHFTKLSALLLTLLVSGAMAAPAAEGESVAPRVYREEPAPGEVTTYPPYSGQTGPEPHLAKRGFGCPGYPRDCDNHVS